MITVTLHRSEQATDFQANPMSITIPRGELNENLQHVAQSCQVTVAYEPEILEILALRSFVKATVEDETGTLFTGIIDTGATWTDKGFPTPIDSLQLKINDNTYLLDKQTEDEVALINTTLKNVIEKICSDCKITISADTQLPDTHLKAFIMDTGTSYLQALNKLLFQHELAFIFTGTGELSLIDFSTPPEDLPVIGQDKILTGFSPTRTTKKYGAVKIGYTLLTQKKDQQVYFEGNDLGEDNKVVPITVRPGQYYPYQSDPTQEAREGQVYQEFAEGYAESYQAYNGETKYRRSQKTSLLYTENQRLVQDWQGSIVVDRTDFQARRASVRLRNTGTQDANLLQLAIRADAWYREPTSYVTAGSGNEYLYEGEYLYTPEAAEKLSKTLSRFFLGGNFKLSGRLTEPLGIGQFVHIDTGLSGFQADALCLSCSFEPESEIYSVQLITYGNIAIDVHRFKNYVGRGDPNAKALSDLMKELQSIVDGDYTGIPPTAPSNVLAVATRDSIQVSFTHSGVGLGNTIAFYVVAIDKGDGKWKTYYTDTNTFYYQFDRSTDGYPEKSNLKNWKVKIKAVNIYGEDSPDSAEAAINLESYLTWELAAPVVTKRESNRVITLYFEQPTRSDGLERYGNIQHRVQIKRVTAPTDSGYFKPATSANPYESEENYKDGSGYVIAGESYAQTLPLAGQDLADPIPEDTTYGFMVVAYNEAGESPAAEINAVAHATSIRDIVENAIGNAQIKQDAVTADKIYVRMLSAIQENIGYITGGVFEGTENNRWALSTITLEDGSTRYEGAMRVGGDDEYFEVEPYNIVNGVPQNYHVKFKAGNFEIAAQASSINGVLYIQANENSLDRTRISPNGTYYQHRETVNSEWQTIASSNVNGVMTKQVFSDDTLFITNQDMAERRKQGYDIGNAYLSSASKVYHFDTDIFDQNGVNDLVIEDAEIDGGHNIVGKENESDDIDFTPAILAIAPYATLGKSLYGRYGITGAFGSCDKFTVDFWLQYIYAENQIIFDIGNTGDKIKLIIAAGECYFEKGSDDESGIPFNAEITQSRLYNLLPLRDVLFNKASENEIAFNAAANGECPFESIAVKEFNANYVYYVKTTTAGVEVWSVATVTAATYYALLSAGLYEKTLPFNSPKEAHSYIEHDGQTQSEQRELSDIGVSFTPNSWLHIGIIASTNKITVALNDRAVEFIRYETAAAALSVVLNSSRNSFMLDELLVDITEAEAVDTFYEHTTNRVPWANLSKSNDYFILTVKDLQNFKTNIFDTQLFKDKVAEVIQDYINNNTQE